MKDAALVAKGPHDLGFAGVGPWDDGVMLSRGLDLVVKHDSRGSQHDQSIADPREITHDV